MKLSIIGAAGTVGSCTAYTLALKGLGDEIVMIDKNQHLLLSHVMDINSAIAGTQDMKIYAGKNEDLVDSDLVLILAGGPNLANSTHEEMLKGNLQMVKEITGVLETYCPKAVVITATNPVDSVNLGIFLTSKKFNRSQLLGYNYNDSLRLKMALASELKCKTTEVDALALGEHVLNMAFIFNSAKIKNKKFTLSKEARTRVKTAVPAILKEYLKLGINRTAGWTSASGIAKMVDAIINDRNTIFPCSAVVDGEYGYKGISIGVPVVLGKRGIKKIVELELDGAERNEMNHAATILTEKAITVQSVIRGAE